MTPTTSAPGAQCEFRQTSSLLACPLFLAVIVSTMGLSATIAAAEKVQFVVDASRTGPKIDRNPFGQFAEHLGHGIYEGVWVGPDSGIPNTRGIRNDVVAALKALKAPNVRWPGGCFGTNITGERESDRNES